MDTKCADPDLQLDVDIMMIDYLIHSALRRVIKESKQSGQQSESTDNALHMVEDCLVLFNAHHPVPPDMPNTEFRLEVLQFATLFGRRKRKTTSSPSTSRLRDLRAENAERSQKWTASHPQSDTKVRSDTLAEPLFSEEQPVMLLDLLPLFMSISAMRADGNPSSYWMNLAAEFMLQAVLEALAFVQNTSDADDKLGSIIREAFSWGRSENFQDPRDDLFWDFDNGIELKEWITVRSEYLSETTPKSGMDLIKHLNSVKQNYPLQDFETIMLKYITTLSTSVEQPLLVQLQGTQVNGLTKRETLKLKLRCGLSK
ncbi:hypothetical protein ANO11243_055290 [Dothideomycetidae sp. 11243]|nr:hypothetical protein ANO11243_055290 [fungal sp. No.11243]